MRAEDTPRVGGSCTPRVGYLDRARVGYHHTPRVGYNAPFFVLATRSYTDRCKTLL